MVFIGILRRLVILYVVLEPYQLFNRFFEIKMIRPPSKPLQTSAGR
jgi:hypothetical protein